MHTNNFLFQISDGTFHVLLDFPCALFIAKIVIFLIVSKEIQKYDQRKFYFFSEKKFFHNMVFTFIAEKKIAKKIYNFFFRTPKLQNKKIGNKQNFE